MLDNQVEMHAFFFLQGHFAMQACIQLHVVLSYVDGGHTITAPALGCTELYTDGASTTVPALGRSQLHLASLCYAVCRW